MTRRSPGRATRQILSGAELSPRETVGGRAADSQPVSLTFWFFIGLAALTIASAIAWAIWGMAAASPLLLLLALGLMAAWLVL